MRKIVFSWWISRIMSELIAMIVGTFTGVLCYGFIIGSIVLMIYMSAGGLFGILLIILLLISLLFFLLHSIIFAANRDKSLPTPAFGFRDLKVPFPVKLFCFQAFGLDLPAVVYGLCRAQRLCRICAAPRQDGLVGDRGGDGAGLQA